MDTGWTSLAHHSTFLIRCWYWCHHGPLNPELECWSTRIKEGHFHRDKDLRESTKRWIAQHISVDRDGADWVLDPRGLNNNSNLTFAAKFIWPLVRYLLSPVSVDHILTWDKRSFLLLWSPSSKLTFRGCFWKSSMKRIFRPRPLTPFIV